MLHVNKKHFTSVNYEKPTFDEKNILKKVTQRSPT